MPIGAVKDQARSQSAGGGLRAAFAARILPVGHVRSIRTPSASTVVAFGVSVDPGGVTLVAPEYCGSGPTVLWGRTHSTVAQTHSTVGPLASRVNGPQPGWDPQVTSVATKLHVRHVCTICVLLQSTLVGFDTSVARLWFAAWEPFIWALWSS